MNRIMDLPVSDRPREKMSRFGVSSLSNTEILALFLRTGIPGRSALQISQDLLDHYGTLTQLGTSTLGDLSRFPGLGLAKACQLAAAFELGSRAAREALSQAILDSPEKIHQYFSPQLSWLRQEKLLVALLDTRLRHLSTHEISTGTVNQTIAHPRDILRPVITQAAYGFILLHNHPSGDPSPSRADSDLTRRLVDSSEILQLRFLDHVIIGHPEGGRRPYYSFREAGVVL